MACPLSIPLLLRQLVLKSDVTSQSHPLATPVLSRGFIFFLVLSLTVSKTPGTDPAPRTLTE
jgi:hypothetical protein